MTLTTQQASDVRRFAGYSVSGNLATQPYRELAYSNVAYASLSLDYRLANLLPEEESTLTTVFLPNLAAREAEIQAVSTGLSVDTAGPFKRNSNELSERKRLYNDLRIELCNFIGFPCGPAISTNQLVRG